MISPRFSILALLLLISVFSEASSSCWRNTTCSGPDQAAFPGSWQSNIYAPSSRTVNPKSILSLPDGKFVSSYHPSTTLTGNGSALVFDFGIEVGGIVSLAYSASGAGKIGLAFTEASTWIGEWSDSSNGGFTPDGAIYGNITTAGIGTYVIPDAKLRGGFRYLTVFLVTSGNISVTLTDVSLEIGFQPTWSNLQAYQGYFHSNDELLNRIWYSGAYTLQTNAVPVNTGRHVPFVKNQWANDGALGPGDTIIVDGAKRDRAVWPGDMGIAVPSTFISIGDLDSVRNALQTMYNNQNADGSFPEAGPPLLQQGSDTYHMWSMIGTYNYVLYTDDTSFLLQNWARYLKAMAYIYAKVGSSGLLNVTGTRDWARWATGFNNSEANMILYRTLVTALRNAINTYCWDASYGAFKDNATATTLHPQDANSMAILFDVVSSSQAESISSKLTANWSPIGAVAPELPENISPFISSFEIQAHLSIGQTARALDLIRRSWGWYINHPNGTGSTVIEGYLVNGTFGYRYSRGYDYDASYVSHSHGWSSGPTSALTEYILGLSVTSPIGKTWNLAPQFGDLKSVQGGFTTSLGKYKAKWNLVGGGYVLEFSTPKGTSGKVTLPCLKKGVLPYVLLNGKSVRQGAIEKGTAKLKENSALLSLSGGDYTIIVR